ncbi:hypothetical protein R1sor_000561 [Riccia sorocarpa]|uniref:Uncharacterized protein n=1 Tax=Riccia sorocarpa TaxID=122646 RepID=A0ABD3GXF0_9MARC
MENSSNAIATDVVSKEKRKRDQDEQRQEDNQEKQSDTLTGRNVKDARESHRIESVDNKKAQPGEGKQKGKETAKDETDPRIMWEKKWYRIRELLKKMEADKIKHREEKKADLLLLYKLRTRIAAEESDEAMAELKQVEDQIRDIKAKQEKMWKSRSMLKWLQSGDMPSKFSFKL